MFDPYDVENFKDLVIKSLTDLNFRDLIIEIGNKGKTIIIASHILDEIEKICTHCAILKNGKLLRTGTINEIIGNQENTLIKIRATDENQLEKTNTNLMKMSLKIRRQI